MEDVLDLYAQAPDEKRPLVCFDERLCQLIGDVTEPIPPKPKSNDLPGQPEKIDYEYERNGSIVSERKIFPMKINRFGKAEILNPQEITLLFTEGLVKPRDRALFGVCLYAAARINESCTLQRGDIIGTRGIRPKLIIRAYNTKGGQDTREIQVHPKLKEFLEEYSIELKGRNPHLFPGRHGLGHIHKASADRILREALRRVDLDEKGMSSHSFRRTALTWMSDSGVPLRHIQSISGHRSLAALERYLGMTEQQKENAISTLVF